MAGFVRFDPYAWLENQRQTADKAQKDHPEDKPETFAGFATFAALPTQNENQDIGYSDTSDDHHHHIENQKRRPTPAKLAKVAKVESPGGPFGNVYAVLESKCPDRIPEDRWRQAVKDGRAFLAQWGEQAKALGWAARDLFGLHTPPANPHPSYSRLSRYDATGLIWLLRGCRVVALTENTAAIERHTGNIITYRKLGRSFIVCPNLDIPNIVVVLVPPADTKIESAVRICRINKTLGPRLVDTHTVDGTIIPI